VSGKKNKKTETSVFVIWNFYSGSTPVLQNSSPPVLAKPLNFDPRKAGSWTGPEDQAFDVE
jgi:hypothetical protein